MISLSVFLPVLMVRMRAISSAAITGQEFQENLSLTETDDVVSFHDLALTPEEKEKFEVLGPISQQEVEEIDWDLLMDDLNS